MSHNGHDAYLEGRILSADPLELIRLLYHGCSNAVRDARRMLADGDIAGRARAITKAFDILAELMHSLDRERGGEICQRLALLYDYMQRRLTDANLQQADAPLAEVLGLLSTLAEAWDGLQAQSQPGPPVTNPWAQAPMQEPQTPAVHAWSF